jgi:hypothetical protein
LESESGCNVVLVHTELHDHRQRDLYALCVSNDVVSAKAQKWQLAALMTAPELFDLLGIDRMCLPYGVRSKSQHFREYRQIAGSHSMVDALKDIKDRIKKIDSVSKDVRYQQLKCVQTNGHRTENVPVLEVRLSTFCKLVADTLEDDKVALYPLVSIVSKKHRKKRTEDFSIDYLLPVQVGEEWVGVVYRDGVPTQALMDHYDITNKTILCNPSCDVTALNMFQNPRYQRLRIKPDLDTNTESVSCGHSSEDIRESTPCDMIAETVNSESTPRPSMFEMSPSLSAAPSMISSLPTLQMFTPSLTSSITANTSFGSDCSSLDLTPSLTASLSVSTLPPLPPVAVTPLVLPIPNMPITFGVSETEQLLQWTNQILVNGMHNLGQFEKFLVSSRESKQ